MKRYYRHNITDQISDDKNKLWEYVEKIEASNIARRLVTWSCKEEDFGRWNDLRTSYFHRHITTTALAVDNTTAQDV